MAKTPNDFWFGSTLGDGAYATVLHSKLKSNSQEYAIKVVEKMHMKRENKVKYVMMERVIMSSLSHPLIVKLFYSFQDSEYLYFCMDLAHGGELASYIRHCKEVNENGNDLNVDADLEPRACSMETTQFYAAELLSALSYLHRKRIIHRDVKPENILIHKSGHIRLTDFGTSLKLEDRSSVKVTNRDSNNEIPSLDEDDETDLLAQRTSFVGTADYVSPEVLSNECVTGACDLWAVGCVIFHMLTGTTPFKAASEYMTFQAIGEHCREKSNGASTINFPSHIPPEARDLIWCLLRPRPKDRLGYGGAAGQFFEWENNQRERLEKAGKQELNAKMNNNGNDGINMIPFEPFDGIVDNIGKSSESDEDNSGTSRASSVSSTTSTKMSPPSVPMYSIDASYPAIAEHSFFNGLEWGSSLSVKEGISYTDALDGNVDSLSDSAHQKPLWKQDPPYVPEESSFHQSKTWRDGGSPGWLAAADLLDDVDTGVQFLSLDSKSNDADDVLGASSNGDGGTPGTERSKRNSSTGDLMHRLSSIFEPFILNTNGNAGSRSQSRDDRYSTGSICTDIADPVTSVEWRPSVFSSQTGILLDWTTAPQDEQNTEQWSPFIEDNERLIFTSVAWKRKNLFTKRRQLILTDKPRIFYVDPQTMQICGNMPFSKLKPLSCKKVSDTEVDITASATGRVYHWIFNESLGSKTWIELIEAMTDLLINPPPESPLRIPKAAPTAAAGKEISMLDNITEESEGDYSTDRNTTASGANLSFNEAGNARFTGDSDVPTPPVNGLPISSTSDNGGDVANTGSTNSTNNAIANNTNGESSRRRSTRVVA